MAEIKDLKTTIDGVIVLFDSALGSDVELAPPLRGRKKGSIQYSDDEKAVDWIIQEINICDLARAIHIRNAIEKFSLKGASQEAVYDRIRRKVRIRIKSGN